MTQQNDHEGLTRRDFVRAGITAAAVTGITPALRADEPPADQQAKKGKKDAGGDKVLVPTRLLGKTGEKVSILNFGAGGKKDARMLNAMWDAGIRYIDTADCYGKGESEKTIAEWLEKSGHRKEIFLVTKDHPKSPAQWVEMLDRRLEALKTDYLDLFFIHMLERKHLDWAKSKEWADAAEKMKKSKKIRFAGFSTHAEMDVRIASLNNAATGGWVDALMTAYDPQLVKDNKEFDKALDACHKAGIGLISMKQMRGVKDAPQFLPDFEKLGLTPHEAVLHAVWSDERIASICSDMPNLEILKANAKAARNFKPLDKKTMGAVIDLYRQYASAYCNGCDGSCHRAAGTKARLHDMVRYLAYYEMDGRREDACRAYAALSPEERNWHDANLAAASQACINKLDFTALLNRAESKLA